MANMSDFLELALANHIFRNATYAKPGGLWVALFTVTPSDVAGSGTEVSTSGTGYARYSSGVPADGTWTNTAGVITNTGAFTFPVPTGNWTPTTPIVAFGIFDAATAGNMLIWGPISPSKSVNNGDPAPQFIAGALQVTFA